MKMSIALGLAVAVFAAHGAALLECDGNVRYKECPGVDHNCWTPTYADQDVLKCFFAQRKK